MRRIVSSLLTLAEFDCNEESSLANFSVYIIDVIPVTENCKYQFYVGSTWKTVQGRHEEHKDKGQKAAKVFKRNGDAGDIRWDLMDGFPKFHTRVAAERAEGRVARWLQNQGYSVSCNMLEKE